MIGIGSASPRGISGLGKTWVNGRSRVPLPPARRTACMALPPWRSTDHELTPQGTKAEEDESSRHVPSIELAAMRSILETDAAACGDRLRRRDLLEDLDQPRDVAVERLLAARAARRGPPSTCRASSSAMRSRASASGRPGVGGGDDEAFAAVGDQLARAVAGGGDHRQAAGQGLEDDERAGVVIGRQDEEVARPEARRGCRAGSRAGGRYRSRPSRGPSPERTGLAAAADEQVDRPRRRVAPVPLGQRQQERLEPLEPEVVADEQADQVVRPQAELVPEVPTDRGRVVDRRGGRRRSRWGSRESARAGRRDAARGGPGPSLLTATTRAPRAGSYCRRSIAR